MVCSRFTASMPSLAESTETKTKKKKFFCFSYMPSKNLALKWSVSIHLLFHLICKRASFLPFLGNQNCPAATYCSLSSVFFCIQVTQICISN